MNSYVIEGAKLFNVHRPGWEEGNLFIENGKFIKAPIHDDQRKRMDAHGCFVMPGLIDAHCHIGLFEDAVGPDGEDGNEMTDPVTPQLRAIDGIYPMDRTFKEALEGGVTTAVTGPGSANVIGGQFAAVKTWGRTVEEKLLRAPVAMKVAFGENPKRVYNSQKKTPMTRMATASILREALYMATEYREKKNQATADPSKLPAFDLRWESLIPVLEKKIPLKVHAHRADDIMTAIRIAEEFGLRLTLDHCTEGHLIADILSQKGYPAIVGPSLGDRPKVELRNLTFETPRILVEAGMTIALMTDAPVIPLKHLLLCAQFAVKNGLDRNEALIAITWNPARIIGIDDRVGALDPGLDADLVIFNGDPLDFNSSVEAVFVNGNPVFTAEQSSFRTIPDIYA
ncbi:MAG TPA: amidohydrolase family protein [Bacillota bacterium]|nr:amidohydrolase family protein [Bacillota bacterium]